MKKDSIGNRMKENYEFRSRAKLIRRIPVIIRLDGKAFHTLTRKCVKPFDENFLDTMTSTALYLCRNIQGAKCAYCQSDEISILVTDYDKLNTDAWFDYIKSKVESISSGMASAHFTTHWCYNGDIAVFDSRAFNVPKEEVCNYFIWRQQDWVRNSIHMYARSLYSHKELQNKNQSDMHEMIHKKGLNWADLPDEWKNGSFIYQVVAGIGLNENSWLVHNIVFTKHRDVIERLLRPKEE